jgi:F-type H+-transporting ATPase subunit gamma
MANILDIRRRIRSVTNTRQITKAMKMVSAARLRRAQDRALAARPYAEMLTNVLKSLVSRAEVFDPETGEPRHPLLAQRGEQNVLLVVVTGDKGLAGAFNTNILKAAMHFLESKAGQNVEIETIGRKGRDFMRRRFPRAEPRVRGQEREPSAAPSVTLIGEQVGVLNKLDYSVAGAFAERVIERYSHGDIDSVYLLFNEFKSVIVQRLVVEQILPVEHIGWTVVSQATEMTKEEKAKARKAAVASGVGFRAPDTTQLEAEAAKFGTARVDYIYEQSPNQLFNSLLPKYIGVQIFRSLLESIAAEHAARMTAMEAATNNASDMIDSLTLAMNRARQAKITKEIIEIVSGAAAAR